MIIKKSIFLILLNIMFGCSISNPKEPETDEPKEKCPEGVCTEEKYEFPDISGMTGWDKYPNLIQARLDCLQIPDACLETLTTKGLLETCYEYPYYGRLFLFDDPQIGFNALVKRFNGYQELFKRHDLINALIEKYAAIGNEVPAILSQSDINKGEFSLRLFVFEMMLAQNVVVENLSEEQEKTLVLLSFDNKEMINNNPDIFSNMHDVPRFLLYAKIVINDPDFEFESVEQKNAVLNFIQIPVDLDQQIADYIENYIYEKYKQ